MIAVLGSGPAALMIADVVSAAGRPVTVFEKRKSAGRKLLVAGSSGLNISNSLPLEEFIAHYTGPREFWRRVIGHFPPAKWLRFIEAQGIGTFEGTSGRYFVEGMKASKFLQAWLARLSKQGVTFAWGRECTGFSYRPGGGCQLRFADGSMVDAEAAAFALGGGSWEPTEDPLRWPAIFREQGLGFTEFTPANVGYRVDWPAAFLKEAEGLPLKRILLKSRKGSREGDAMITHYGIEGTPVYFVGQTGRVTVDLRPDLDARQILRKLQAVKENLSPIRRVKKQLALCPAAFALVFHLTPPETLRDATLQPLVERIKAFPLELLGPQPLAEAISSAGGLSLSELDETLMFRRFPGVFAAGEMLDWDAPTGGFLIQACVAQGAWVGESVVKYLSEKMTTPARPPR